MKREEAEAIYDQGKDVVVDFILELVNRIEKFALSNFVNFHRMECYFLRVFFSYKWTKTTFRNPNFC